VNPILRLAGKTGGKAVAVFAATANEASVCVRYLVKERVGLPIVLFTCEVPSPSVAASCTEVVIHKNPATLFFSSQRKLWRYWIALGVASWNGNPGNLMLKVAPFFLPPFRVLIANKYDDFFPGRPGKVWNHIWIDLRIKLKRKLTETFIGVWHVIFAYISFFFAQLAQQNSALSRIGFRRFRGREVLTLAPVRKSASGVAVFEYQGRAWPLKEFKTFLESTESRWVLFQAAGTTDPYEDMLRIASEARTFAVSRQHAFRAWQQMLFPIAPFQTLQPNEVTRVLAPFSHQILVDRAKLMALGLPEMSESGSNWFLLFWRAAAAGWNSYSIGGTANLNELPGYPYFEAQFVYALMVDPELARLTPRDPLLARGNITTASAGGKGFRGLPRVMVLSPYLPYPLSHGGAVRIYSLCKALADRVDFVLVCFREKNDVVNFDKLFEVFREVHVVAVDEKHANDLVPSQVSGYESMSLRALIPDLCFRLRIDLLQIEYTQMAAYRETVPHIPAILVEHDITFTLFRQLADLTSTADAQREYTRWLTFETDRLGAFEQVWTMSEHDRGQAIEVGSNPAVTLAVPNGVDLKRFAVGPSPSDALQEILYVGSFRHRPNFLGFKELRDSIMPQVWAAFPEIRLRVVAGPNHENHWEGSRELNPRIVIHGFVEDVASLYAQCQLVVVPLPVSAGTNVKVMEALATERAVVTTPVGCVGLGLEDGQDIVIRNLESDFAAAIVELAADSAKRHAIARRGRETAEARFSWESIAETADAGYRELLQVSRNNSH